MRRIYFIIFVVALFGCGTLEKKSILINIDDDKQKVLSIMGTPDDRQTQGKQEAWQYCISGAGFGYNDHRVVWFNNGYVTGITSYIKVIKQVALAASDKFDGKTRLIVLSNLE